MKNFNGREIRQLCKALDISYHTLNSYLRYAPRAGRTSHDDEPGNSERVSPSSSELGALA